MITNDEHRDEVKKNEDLPLIEGFDGLVLHPSLDIQRNILSLGFRLYDKDIKLINIIIIVHDGRIKITREDTAEVVGKKLMFESRGRLLQRISERWSLEKLNRLITNYQHGKGSPYNVSEVLPLVVSKLKQFVQLNSELDYTLVGAWSIGTYFYPIFSAFPYLNPHGPKGSGKSQLLNVLQQYCFNARKARPTTAALGDIVDSLRGTFLIDQAELLWRKGNEDLCDILTDSYKRGGGKRVYSTLDKDRQRNVKECDTYSPKAIASTGEIPPDLRDRLLPVQLLRSNCNFPDPDEATDDWNHIRDILYTTLIHEFPNVLSLYCSLKTLYRHSGEVVGRQLELWLPIETILTFFGVDSATIKEARVYFLQQYSTNEDEPSDLESAVIRFVLNHFPPGNNEVELSPKEIALGIDQDVFPPRVETDKHRATNVGRALHKYNLFRNETRTGNGKVYNFVREHVALVCQQYLPGDKHTEHTLTPSDPFDDAIKSMQDVGLLPTKSV